MRLWNPTYGDPIGDLLTSRRGEISGLTFNHDATQLAFGAGTTVWIWANVWDPAQACRLADPYVTAEQVEAYLRDVGAPMTCQLD